MDLSQMSALTKRKIVCGVLMFSIKSIRSLAITLEDSEKKN